MGNIKIFSVLVLLLMIPGTQVHALDEDEFVYGIEVGKTYKWKAIVNDAIPDGISLEYELSIHIHSITDFMVDHTFQETLTGGDIDTYNEKYPEAEVYEGKILEDRYTEHASFLDHFFLPVNDEYPSSYQENVPGVEFSEHLFSYTIIQKGTFSGPVGETTLERKTIYAKNTGLVVYRVSDRSVQNDLGETIMRNQIILEYQGIEALANPRILTLTTGFSILILAIVAVLFYRWRKGKKNQL